MSTTVYYNGVLMRDCETKVFDQQIVYDDSNTDVMFSRYRIRVTSTLIAYTGTSQNDNTTTVRFAGDSGNPLGSAPDNLRRVHHLLNQKGKLFYYYIKGAPTDQDATGLVQSSDTLVMAIGTEFGSDFAVSLDPTDLDGVRTIAASAVYDVENGPKPKNVRVEGIYGGRLMRVSFEIEIARVLCVAGADPAPDDFPSGTVQSTGDQVLSNRWHLSESKDENWVTTRTLQGTLRVSSKDVKPHLMRGFVLPNLLPGYQRVAQNFATDPTDLVLKYRIDDRQRHEAPPQPAIDWSGHHVESAGKNGTQQVGEVRVRLIGPPGVDKKELIGAAGQVVAQRLNGLTDPQDDPLTFNEILLNAAIVDVIAEPVIEMQVAIQRTKSLSDEQALRNNIETMGMPLVIDGYDADKWPVPLAQDADSLAGVFSCYLQDPCSQWHAVPRYPTSPDDSSSSGDPDGRPGYEENDYASDADPRVYEADDPFTIPDDSLSTSEHLAGYPYTYVKIHTEYERTTGRVQMPLAAVASGATCKVIQLHAGMERRIFQMEATRIGKPPVIPTPSETITDTNGITETLLSRKIGIRNPEFKTDANAREFRVLAEYVYALSRPVANNEKFRKAISPIDSTTGETRLLDTADLFTSTLVEWPVPA